MTIHGPQEFRRLFAQQVGLPDDHLNLGLAALYLAGEEYPNLVVSHYLDMLDQLAAQVRADAGETDAAGLAQTLRRHLFDLLGFTGNPADYYNPDNSFLNRALDSRMGLPITLSVIFLEVARRLGLNCYGVGMPGHFLVGLAEPELYLDPFHSGSLLSARDCQRLAREMFGPTLTWNDAYLAPCPGHLILYRMLNNLRLIYGSQGDHQRAAAALERMILIDRRAAPSELS